MTHAIIHGMNNTNDPSLVPPRIRSPHLVSTVNREPCSNSFLRNTTEPWISQIAILGRVQFSYDRCAEVQRYSVCVHQIEQKSREGGKIIYILSKAGGVYEF